MDRSDMSRSLRRAMPVEQSTIVPGVIVAEDQLTSLVHAARKVAPYDSGDSWRDLKQALEPFKLF